ncbi:MAG: cation:proton antiporter [Pseudonocardiaceae bacterium]
MTTTQVTFLLFDLAIIVLIARVFGVIARRLGQPAVVGEILAGILLGPTLFHGAIAGALFPDIVRPMLGALANVGVAVFMFIVGLELDRTVLRGKMRVATTLSLSSVLLPFCLGLALAFYLAAEHAPPDRTGFVLFIGAALSVTAFPVLVRILRDRGMHRSALGVLACTCAALADVLAWSMLAVIVAISGHGGAAHWRLLMVLPYLIVLFGVVRPLLRWYVAREGSGHVSQTMIAVLVVGLLLSGTATEWVGLHIIFGAFLFGIAVPKEGMAEWVEKIGTQIGRFNEVLLLPIFFVVAGLRVDLSKIDGSGLVTLGLILLAAVGGKFGGTFLAARAHGLADRQSAALGALMNTRGLTELIILTAGQQLGLLDDRLYTLMVVVALTTTAMTGPLLNIIKVDQDAPLGAVRVTSRELGRVAVEPS